MEEVVHAAVSLARQAAQSRGLVALDIGPIGQLLQPTGTLEFEDAVTSLPKWYGPERTQAPI